MEIRSATSDDVPAVLELWGSSRSGHAVTDDTPGSLALLLGWDDGALLLALDGERVLGALVAAWDGFRGNMYRLAVAPDRRREGIGLALVRAGEQRLRALGARKICAVVGTDDAVAVGLWEAAGYEDDPSLGRFSRVL